MKVRKYLLAKVQHRHEVGEDRAKCRNCQLAEEGEKMSRFEAFSWNWAQSNPIGLIIEAGVLGRTLDRLGLNDVQERFFLKAVNMIRQFFLKLQVEDVKK